MWGMKKKLQGASTSKLAAYILLTLAATVVILGTAEPSCAVEPKVAPSSSTKPRSDPRPPTTSPQAETSVAPAIPPPTRAPDHAAQEAIQDIYWLLWDTDEGAVFGKLSERSPSQYPRVRLWTVWVYKELSLDSGRASAFEIHLDEIDCAEQTTTILQVSNFDIRGSLIRSWQPTPTQRYIRPGSNAQLTMLFACRPDIDPTALGMTPVPPSFNEPRFLVGYSGGFVFSRKR